MIRSNSLQKSLCPVVTCPYLRSSEKSPCEVEYTDLGQKRSGALTDCCVEQGNASGVCPWAARLKQAEPPVGWVLAFLDCETKARFARLRRTLLRYVKTPGTKQHITTGGCGSPLRWRITSAVHHHLLYSIISYYVMSYHMNIMYILLLSL